MDSSNSYETMFHHSISQNFTAAQDSNILNSITHRSIDTLDLGKIDAQDVVEPRQGCFFSMRVC